MCALHVFGIAQNSATKAFQHRMYNIVDNRWGGGQDDRARLLMFVYIKH